MAVLPVCVQRRIPLVVATTGHTPAQKRGDRGGGPRDGHADGAEHEPGGQRPDEAGRPGGEAAARARASTSRSWSGITASRRTRPAARPCTSPASSRRRWARRELRHGREGLVGERPPHEIGIHAIRVGDNVGEHTIVFSTLGETLELTHTGHTRDCYARGALQAAKFLAGRAGGTLHDERRAGAVTKLPGVSSLFRWDACKDATPFGVPQGVPPRLPGSRFSTKQDCSRSGGTYALRRTGTG